MAEPKVIYPEQFQQEFDDTEIPPGSQVLGYVKRPKQSAQVVTGDPLMESIVGGTTAVTTFLYDHRMFIRNTALILGGTYAIVKGPPLVAKSIADTAHYMREAWYGRGYENKEK
jgi:hypothetical protein